jgi:predicted heme/steroid binding protein
MAEENYTKGNIVDERIFTLSELHQYDGYHKPPYIAFEGIVYDVSQSRLWSHELHEGIHFPGQDLTNAIMEAPHGREVFTRPGIRRVGLLAG